MLTFEQFRLIHSACERLTAQGHLLEKTRNPEEERSILLLIGDESSSLSKAVEQLLAPWNHGRESR
jgi:hypothetical protein